MKQAKDNFSSLATGYSKFRPDYPSSLYDYLYSLCSGFDQALDCGTGNGQVALALSKKFRQVQATDISEAQVNAAPSVENVHFSVSRAEQTTFEHNSFDLITVGQAYHWFDFEAFGKEANRLLKPEGIICIFSYHLLKISPVIDALIDDFYRNVVGPYWDPERDWVDRYYRDVPFPFIEIPTSFQFDIQKSFSLAGLEGYFNTWSAVKHFKNKNGRNPVDDLMEKIRPHWTSEQAAARFPGFIRLGKKWKD